jgi:hypothetical protein
MSSEKLVLATMKTSFSGLRDLIRHIDFAAARSEFKHLPEEICSNVASFLTVQRCVPSDIEAVAASSMDSLFKLEGCLVDDEESWWLSGEGTMPRGRGEAYVEVRLAKDNSLRRIQSVSMSIPPLPAGPLSVREFRVDVSSEQGVWVQLPFVFQVENVRGMQRFSIGNVDARSIRVVCLSNQISHALLGVLDELNTSLEQVGFYAIRVE